MRAKILKELLENWGIYLTEERLSQICQLFVPKPDEELREDLQATIRHILVEEGIAWNKSFPIADQILGEIAKCHTKTNLR